MLQNSIISNCLGSKRRHDSLLVGDLDIRDISDSELLSLRRPMFTHVGMGGIGPYYSPSFTVLRLVFDELESRRLKKLKEKENGRF